MAATNESTVKSLGDGSVLNADSSGSFSVVSFNLHGFNQGSHVIRELIDKHKYDILLVQEHWLTPANVCLSSTSFPKYVAIGISAMEDCVSKGPLRERPFGGVAFF
jgi:hypothetical protein